MGEILNKAIVYAVKVHNGQVRKGTQVPYILHPLEAASIVGTLTTDEEVIAAAVLHDVVEDTAATTECIQEPLGKGSPLWSLQKAKTNEKICLPDRPGKSVSRKQ